MLPMEKAKQSGRCPHQQVKTLDTITLNSLLIQVPQ